MRTRFEPPLDAAQQDVWFRRNCRCLKDILQFCHSDIPLALTTIDVCLKGMEKAGFTGGYEAVLRNITNYYTQAQKRWNRNLTIRNKVRISPAKTGGVALSCWDISPANLLQYPVYDIFKLCGL